MPETNFNLVYLIKILKKWRKPILLVTLIAFIGSAIIALQLPVYYKSTAIFYPYSPKTYDPKFILSDVNHDIFGNNADMDRVLAIGNSYDVANYIIEKYRLIERYEIDTTEEFYKNTVLKEFQDNISISKNEKGAAQVTVLDQDRDIAAKIANDIVDKIDHLSRIPTIINNKKIIGNYKKSIEESTNTLDSLTKTYRSGIDDNNSLDKEALMVEFLRNRSRLKDLEIKLSMLDEEISTLHIIESAFPAEKKHKPVRWLIVVTSTIFTFIFVILIAVIAELYRENKHLFADAN